MSQITPVPPPLPRRNAGPVAAIEVPSIQARQVPAPAPLPQVSVRRRALGFFESLARMVGLFLVTPIVVAAALVGGAAYLDEIGFKPKDIAEAFTPKAEGTYCKALYIEYARDQSRTWNEDEAVRYTRAGDTLTVHSRIGDATFTIEVSEVRLVSCLDAK